MALLLHCHPKFAEGCDLEKDLEALLDAELHDAELEEPPKEIVDEVGDDEHKRARGRGRGRGARGGRDGRGGGRGGRRGRGRGGVEPVVLDEPVIKDAAVAHPTIQVNVRNDGGSWCEFKYDTKERYIAAHCKHPDHGPHCRLNRTVKINLNNPNQGRPAGLELAWLFNSA